MKATHKKDDVSSKVWALFERDEWEKARGLLEKRLAKEPQNHWLMTQLGVTFYEQKQYRKALKLFLASRALMADCPLTQWNLAGAWDAIGNHSKAAGVYARLLECNTTPSQDPCWESQQWSDDLKTDCVYRLGVCYQKQGDKHAAERCYRRYLDLLSVGANGTYSSDDAVQKLRTLHSNRKNGESDSKRLHKAVNLVFQSLSGGAVEKSEQRM